MDQVADEQLDSIGHKREDLLGAFTHRQTWVWIECFACGGTGFHGDVMMRDGALPLYPSGDIG